MTAPYHIYRCRDCIYRYGNPPRNPSMWLDIEFLDEMALLAGGELRPLPAGKGVHPGEAASLANTQTDTHSHSYTCDQFKLCLRTDGRSTAHVFLLRKMVSDRKDPLGSVEESGAEYPSPTVKRIYFASLRRSTHLVSYLRVTVHKNHQMSNERMRGWCACANATVAMLASLLGHADAQTRADAVCTWNARRLSNSFKWKIENGLLHGNTTVCVRSKKATLACIRVRRHGWCL